MIDSDFNYLDKDQKNKFLYKEKKLLVYKKSNENLDVSILMDHLDEDVIYSSNGIISDVTGRENISTFLINRYKYHKKFSTYKKRNLKRAYAHGLIEKHPFLNFKFEPCLSLEINTINCGYILLDINEFNLIERIMTVDVPIQSIQFVDSFIIENN